MDLLVYVFVFRALRVLSVEYVLVAVFHVLAAVHGRVLSVLPTL